jgi:hypothetical protein
MSKGADRNHIEIQERDVEVLLDLFECRVMTRRQAAILHFGERPEACKRRLYLLRQSGYIANRARQPHEPAVMTLTRRGFQLLEGRGCLARYPSVSWQRTAGRLRVSPLTIRHEVDVMDFRAAIVADVAKDARLAISGMSTWPQMIGFLASNSDGHPSAVRPDGFLCVRASEMNGHKSECYFFLEIDRSTESQSKLIERMYCYKDFYRRGGLAARFGRAVEEFKSFPFRVLVTCRTAERRNNLAERLLASSVKVGAQVWITTKAEAITNPLGPIWITPGDYRKAIAGTHFELAPHVAASVSSTYRRDGSRENWIDEKLAKRRLLMSDHS